MLMEWELGPRAERILRSSNWTPASPEEHVYIAVARRSKLALPANWTKTKEVLLDAVASKNGEKMKGAVCSLLATGQEEIIDDLVAALRLHGTKTVAETYLNCGESTLEDAAAVWASENGYRIWRGRESGAKEASWGRFK